MRFILKSAEEARESRKMTQMTATSERYSIHPEGEGVFVSNFLILFALIGVIRGQLLELGLFFQSQCWNAVSFFIGANALEMLGARIRHICSTWNSMSWDKKSAASFMNAKASKRPAWDTFCPR